MIATVDHIDPKGWYTASQAIALLKIGRTCFYANKDLWGLEPFHRKGSKRPLYFGTDLRNVVCNVFSFRNGRPANRK